MWFSLLGVVVSSLTLIVTTRLAIDAFEKLVVKLKIDSLVLAAMLVAVGTSLPELFVGVASALEGRPEISLGNVLGSNIANLSLVIGGAAMVSGAVPVVGAFMRREFLMAFLAGIMPLVLIIDGSLSRFDGVLLLMAYGFYIKDVMKMGEHKKRVVRSRKSWGLLTRLKWIHENHTDVWAMKLLLGLSGLIISADLLVKFASGLAVSLGVPVFLVGVLVVAVGTSLPELVLEIGAIRRNDVALVFGDLLGSVVANGTMIIGVTALLKPVEITVLSEYALASIAFVVMFGLFWFFSTSKRKLERWEGLVLLGFYAMFAGLELVFK